MNRKIDTFVKQDLRFDVHAAGVMDFYRRASDYVRLETGLEPDMATVEDFFFDHPPGSNIEESFKLGLFTVSGQLVGIADMGFGFPQATDAYIGLMLIEPAYRGKRAGRILLRELETRARSRDATRLLLAVLDENKRGRAFWESEGFEHLVTSKPMESGVKMHVRHRLARPIEPA